MPMVVNKTVRTDRQYAAWDLMSHCELRATAVWAQRELMAVDRGRHLKIGQHWEKQVTRSVDMYVC